MGGRKRDRSTDTPQQYGNRHSDGTTFGIPGTYKQDPSQFDVFATNKSAGPLFDNGNRSETDYNFDETEEAGNVSWSRRKRILIAMLIGLIVVVVIGVTVGIVLAVVEKDDVTPSTKTSTTLAATTITTQTPVVSTTMTQTTVVISEQTESTSSISTTSQATTEMTTEDLCTDAGRFYLWIPVTDMVDPEQIFFEIYDLILDNDAICSVINLGLVQTTSGQRKKRNTETSHLVIEIDATQEDFNTSTVVDILDGAVLDGVSKDLIRVDDVSGGCVLIGTTDSVTETMCRDLGFIYSQFHSYELNDTVNWEPLPQFQAEHDNISCEETSRDLAFCAAFYPDCKEEKQLCPGTCDDVKTNCPAVYEVLGFPQEFCSNLHLEDMCYGKRTPCDPDTEFECPESQTCINVTLLCDGTVDCEESAIDESDTICKTNTTVSTVSIATTTAAPVPNNCDVNQFACVSDGYCIPDYWFCDNYQDCLDNSDEIDCFCPAGKFRCALSIPTACIDEDLVCDNKADCSDSSDEGDCSSIIVNCQKNEFQCIKFPECIDQQRHCDGTEDCQDGSDEWYDCPAPSTPPPVTDFEVRLMTNKTDTTSQLSGRVEIRANGSDDEFGTICDDMWSKEDAEVICKMLNSSFTGEAYAYKNSAFGPGSGKQLMTNVDCYGNETNIGLCKSKRNNIHCSPDQDAAVSCGVYIEIATPAPKKKATVRLLNGGTCLEGLVQVYIQEEWRYVCDDRFDERDATVVCRMLSYESGPGHVQDDYGIGDGVFWLDEVKCRGNETDISQCAANELGVHDCVYYEAVGIVCDGIPDVDCNPEPDCSISSSCTFDTDDCCFGFPLPDPGDGTTRWIRNQAQMMGYPDHTTGSFEGGIVYYRNNFGFESDSASLVINPLLESLDGANSITNKSINFFYLMKSPSIGALSLKFVNSNGDDTVLWTSPYLPKELEGVWQHQCVDIPTVPADADIVFESKRGRKPEELIAIDDVSLAGEECQNGITYQSCMFDVLGNCDMEIICNKCVEDDRQFRWRVFSNETNLSKDIQVPQSMIDNMEGAFIFADATFGQENDKAVVKFRILPDASQHAVQFNYMMTGTSNSFLQISLTVDGITEYVWRSNLAHYNNTVNTGCIQMPELTSDAYINIEAVRGTSLLDDISVDTIEVVDSCPGFISCMEGQTPCDYLADSPFVEDYTWAFRLDEDMENHSSYQIQDNQAPFGSWSGLMSPEFSIRSGQYQLSFSVMKQGTGTLKMYITNGFTREEIYSEFLYYADTFEKHCVTMTLPDLNGVLVFESIKGSLGVHRDVFYDTEVVHVRDVEINPGICEGSLDKTVCSFEDHLCRYSVIPSSNGPCDPVYEWTRNGGTLNYKLLKSDMDHTLGTEKGHYMSVVKTRDSQAHGTILQFQPINVHSMSTPNVLTFYMRMYQPSSDESDLLLNVSGVVFDVKSLLLPIEIWQPVCVDLSDFQTAMLDISFTAINVTCDLDDVTLLADKCPGSISCNFDEDHLCGYLLENGWTYTGKFTYTGSSLQMSKDDYRLISPVFNTSTESCLSLTVQFNTTSTANVRGSLKFLDGNDLTNIYYEERFDLYTSETASTTVQIQFPAVSDAVLTLSFTGLTVSDIIDVDDISLSNSKCIQLVCESTEHVCSNRYCIPSDYICDGKEDCRDGSDEANCDYCKHCPFNVFGECVCRYTSLNVKVETDENLSGSTLEFSSQEILSYVSSPLLNITSPSCLLASVWYGIQDVDFRVIRNESSQLFRLVSFPSALDTDEYRNISVDLDLGYYSVVLEVITLKEISTGPAFTVENIHIVQGVCDSDISEPTTSSPTTVTYPDTTQIEEETDSIQAYLFTDVLLKCNTALQTNLDELTLFWYKDGRQLTRNNDVLNPVFVDMPDGSDAFKYTVRIENGSTLMYNLIIQHVTEEDEGIYECRLDSHGVSMSIVTTTNLSINSDDYILTEDGCYRNTLDVCYQHGFETVQYGGPFESSPNHQDLTLALNALGNSMTSSCQSAVESLTCGLFNPRCHNATAFHICQEYCLEIVSLCLQEDSDIQQLLHYGCFFLPNSDMDSTCYSQWIGCEMTHTSADGIIWMPNFPSQYPETNCTTYIQADRFHSLQLHIEHYDVGPGNGVDPCYFEIYDESNDVSVLKRQCGEDIDVTSANVTGPVARITFISDGYSQGQGYRISYKQDLRFGCTLISVGMDELLLTPDELNEQRLWDGEQCGSVLLYTEDHRDSIRLEVREVIQGCIILYTIDNDGVVGKFESLCNITENVVFEIPGQVVLEIDKQAVYSVQVRRNVYVRQADTVTLGESGRLFVTSEGQYGMACFNIDQPTADILCRSMDLGWPAERQEDDSDMDPVPSIVNDISCTGGEEDIRDCHFSFENELSTCSSDAYSVVQCRETSLSCTFFKSTCGYRVHGNMLFSQKEGLVLQKSESFSSKPVVGEIISPSFRYSDDIYIHIEYGISGDVDDQITMALMDLHSNYSVILWEQRPYGISGHLTDCVRLPDNKDTETLYRLHIKLSSTQSGFSDPQYATALRRLDISPDTCQNSHLPVVCTFENMDTCAIFTDMEELSCMLNQPSTTKVSVQNSALTYRDGTWPNNYLLVDEGQELTLLKNNTFDATSLQFIYAIYIAPGSNNYLSWKLSADGETVLSRHDVRTSWKQTCVDLQEYKLQSLVLQVGDLKDSQGFSSMAIDDFQLNTHPCPDPYSCGFEDSCIQHYSTTSSDSGWKSMSGGMAGFPNNDATYMLDGKGSYMVPELENAIEGSIAVLEVDKIGKSLQCLAFYLYLGKNCSTTVQVMINKKPSNPIRQSTHDKWTLHNIVLTGVTDSIQFVATRGNPHGVLAIDEVLLTESPCQDTLDNSNICTFEYPNLCALEVLIGNGLQFTVGKPDVYGDGNVLSNIPYDADGNFNGTFMFMEGSSSEPHSSSELQFTVSTTKSAYRFWYFVSDNEDTELSTQVDELDKVKVNVTIAKQWILSPCFALSSSLTGKIRIEAKLLDGPGRFVAIDNLQLLDVDICPDYSPTCDFTSNQECGYISEGQAWTRTSNSWSTSKPGNLSVPSVQISPSSTYCFEFLYEAYDIHTADGITKISLVNKDDEIWFDYGKLKVGDPSPLTGQVNLQGSMVNLKFVSSDGGVFRLWWTKLSEGACLSTLDCDTDTEFQCTERCIDRELLCNRVVDCWNGEDEADSNCVFGLETDFGRVTSLEQSGFKVRDMSSTEWTLARNITVSTKRRSRIISEQTLVANFNSLTLSPSILTSRQYYLSSETSCLYLSYYGNVARFTLSQQHENSDTTVENNIDLIPSPADRHLAVPVHGGRVTFTLSVYMVNLDPYYRGLLQADAVFGLHKFEIHEGELCNDLPISCPADFPNLCGNKMSCYTDEEKCNLVSDCLDMSDEKDDCGYGIPCDFEHPNMCGYHNLTLPKTYWDDRDIYQTPQTLWERSYTSIITRPNWDHTYRVTGHGHFMTSKNYEGLQDEKRYVDTEIMQSPYEIFNVDSCITFWYYLNSTAHQPKTGTAQLFVYLQYGNSSTKELLWYDHVNRPFTDWVQGGIPVQASRNVSLIIKAVTFIPYDSWTGVVSMDDIGYHTGDCKAKHPDCDSSMYRCGDDICIPYEFVCDGEPDCHDESDEQTCNRQDGGLQLIGGDDSYGQLGYFHNGQWRPVCYPNDLLERRLFSLHAARNVCRSLDYGGNYDALPYRLWSKHSDTSIVLTCSSKEECTAIPTMEKCDFYAYIKCSPEVCFTDEVLCPGTLSTCKPRYHFCDGEMDCPGNTDELNCKCFENETQCIQIEEDCQDKSCDTCEDRGMFECKNHQCIPLTERCDGLNHCTDGTDEYRCVQTNNEGFVTMFDRQLLERKTVCVNGIDVNIAQKLCQLSGQGYVDEILRGSDSITGGIILKDSDDMITAQAITRSCYPLKLMCKMSECGTTSIQDSLVQTYVINGRDTSIEEWPWYGVLLGDDFLYCGLALISPEWAITATHCIYSDVVYTVVLGSSKPDGSGNWTQTLSVSRIYNYGYDTSGTFPLHDLTLLKLSTEAEINNYTRPICLPQQNTADYIEEIGTRSECYIVGLGATERIFDDPNNFDFYADDLQKKRVRIVPNDICEREWRKGVPTDDPFPDNVYCIATEGPSSPTCFGDSGGPVMCKNPSGRWELFGLVSFGYGNCLHDIIPTVATSVLQYGTWIASVTGFNL